MNSHIQIIKDCFEEIKDRNGSFSLRSYARYLNMPQSTLMLAISGKRKLPEKYLYSIVEKLQLSDEKKQIFENDWLAYQQSLSKVNINSSKVNYTALDEINAEVIAEWEHYAFLAFMGTKNYDGTGEIFTEFFGLDLDRVNVVLDNLLFAGLVKKIGTKYCKATQGGYKTSEDIASKAIRQSHNESLDIAKEKLETIDVLKRDFSSLTLPIHIDKLKETKILIREFREKLDTFLYTEDATNVYRLSIQFFPLDTK